jgi:hypothetical protein
MNQQNLPANQLLAGYKEEGEHTSDPTNKLTIATNHVRKDPEYYDKLKIMEHTPLSKLQSLRKCMGSQLSSSL